MQTANSAAHSQTHSQGSVLGAILLISGCCIGAGMLGLPILSALAGFTPSFIMFLFSWMFMTTTGLLLLEVNLHFRDEVNIVTMAERTLGFIGKVIAWSGFIFLFYCLMIAYISGSGELITDIVHSITGLTLPAWIGSIFCSALLTIALYLGTQAVDHLNRFLMAGLIISYIVLVFLAAPHVDMNLLTHTDWSIAVSVVPIMIISFGFHNLVPSLTSYLNYDAKKLRISLIIGSIIPLVVYMVWEYLILGIVPVQGEGGFQEALHEGYMISQILKTALGTSWISQAVQYFAFFALVTSFIGVALSFLDFLSDGLKIKKNPKGKILLCALVVIFPLVMSLIYPRLFLEALGYAGGIGAVLLFGILPALMAWSGRYHKKLWTTRIVPGGHFTLILIIIISCAIIGLQISQDL